MVSTNSVSDAKYNNLRLNFFQSSNFDEKALKCKPLDRLDKVRFKSGEVRLERAICKCIFDLTIH